MTDQYLCRQLTLRRTELNVATEHALNLVSTRELTGNLALDVIANFPKLCKIFRKCYFWVGNAHSWLEFARLVLFCIDMCTLKCLWSYRGRNRIKENISADF